jgi:YesN/AraC family two-component response regulator
MPSSHGVVFAHIKHHHKQERVTSMSEEIHELHKPAEEAHHVPSLTPVTITMAILAVLVAVVGLLGHRAHREELLLLKNEAMDAWAQYQAESIRRHNYELFADRLSLVEAKNSGNAEKTREKYKQQIERYQGEQKEISTETRSLENEVRVTRPKANRFDLGEIFLEAALVITSMTLLTKRHLFRAVRLVCALAGLGTAVTGSIVR